MACCKQFTTRSIESPPHPARRHSPSKTGVNALTAPRHPLPRAGEGKERVMKLLTVRHATTYRYSAPVIFGQHRLMLRPRDSHDLRLIGAELALSPPGTVRWMHDVFGNSVALVD